MRVRLVGGENKGEEITLSHEMEYVRVPIRCDFAEHPLNVEVLECDPSIAVETYKVHKMIFDTGHHHYYGAPKSWPLVSVLNELWHGYKGK
jgi:hypothetical protein